MLALGLKDEKDVARRRGGQGFQVEGMAKRATVGCLV